MNKENKKSEENKSSQEVAKKEVSSKGESSPHNMKSSQEVAKKEVSFKGESSQKDVSKASNESSSSKTQSVSKKEQDSKEIQLNTLFAYKMGMTHVYEKNQRIPVTAFQYKPSVVTQIKTNKKEGYSGVQVALESSKKPNKAMSGHLKKSGLKKGASFFKEVRQTLPEGIELGQKVSIQSLSQGDQVRVSGISKGHGFSGVVKRWGFGGGPASHGAEKHRTTGSIANTATQGRVFPGKKLPGHFGCDRVTISNLKVVQVHPQEGWILIKGSVPGAQGSLLEIRKQEVRS